MKRPKAKARARARAKARAKAEAKSSALAQEQRKALAAKAKANRDAEVEYEQYQKEQKLSRDPKSDITFVFVAEVQDTTCEECDKLNGTQWSADDPDIPQLPIHENCNCRLVPISLTQDEDYNL